VTPTAAPAVRFDILRPDAVAGLVHVASSNTRWTGIPLLPLQSRSTSTGRREKAAPLLLETPDYSQPVYTPSPSVFSNGSATESLSCDPGMSPRQPVQERAQSEQPDHAFKDAHTLSSRRRASSNVVHSVTRSPLVHRPLRPRPAFFDPRSMGRSLTYEGDAGSGLGMKRRKESDTARRHVCPLCGKRFNRPSSVQTHMHTHNGATRTFILINLV
jgi:hypothetical protein